ncbi:MAG: GNAT family N-acetyltransferase [Armatimonadetes bacterium]|nr:GNAT family N-acetyltransferase [Armatimonadota bacterium]
MGMLQIVDGSSPAWIEEVRTLFLEYAESLGFDLCFQGFEEELATLPGLYAPPCGCILLALCDGGAAGVVAMRPLIRKSGPCDAPFGATEHGAQVVGDGVCEMKRLWVRPAFRGRSLGRKLAEAVVEAGRRAGYNAMVLDTLERMEAARALYASLGFEAMDAYYENPLEGVHYMRKEF